MANSSTSMYGDAPSIAMARAAAPKTKSGVSSPLVGTLIRYTLAGAWGETRDPGSVPSGALIHGRVTT